LAVGDTKPEPKKAAPKQQSHVRQARDAAEKPETSGPMADMLKRLLGK
ncbi:MAG: aminoacyl-tRNA hydrolase, partial [Pseudomonadota bacterium]